MTANINLLPWRQERRDELKKQFFVMLGIAAVVSILIVGSIHFYYQHLIDLQIASNTYIDKEIKILDKRIKDINDIRRDKEQLVARMDVIQQLQANRPNVVLLFDNLVRVTPDRVNYTAVRRRGTGLVIEGYADSNTRVSQLMRNMEDSLIFRDPRLNLIREADQKNQQKGKFFSLRVSQQRKKE